MTEAGNALNLETIIAVLRSRLLVIVGCVVVVAGSAFAFSLAQTKEYTAAAKLLFRDPGLDQQAAGVTEIGSRDPQRDTATNVRLVRLGGVASRTAKQLGDGLTPQAVLNSVEVSPEGATDIATVAATAGSPRRASALANAFTQQFIATRREIDQARVLRARTLVERQLKDLPQREQEGLRGQALVDRSESLGILASLQTGNAELVERATPPASPSSPKVLRNTVLGGILGLLLGVAAAFVLDRLDRRMKQPEDLERAFGLPLLGVVPASQAYATASNNANGVVLPAREGEAFRMLRAHLRYFNVDRDVRTVMVTSAASGEGKSTVAQHLAQAAAMMGTSTLLVEADLRRPSLGERLGRLDGPGLGEVLIGVCSAQAAIRSVSLGSSANGSASNSRLDVLLAGAIPPNPAELIESRAMQELISSAAAEYELVLIDTPPLTVVSDAIPLLRQVDGVIIVSRLGMSTQDAAVQMRNRLTSLGAPTLGVVGNAYDQSKREGYGYGYYQDETAVAAADPSVTPTDEPAVKQQAGV